MNQTQRDVKEKPLGLTHSKRVVTGCGRRGSRTGEGRASSPGQGDVGAGRGGGGRRGRHGSGREAENRVREAGCDPKSSGL